MFNALQVKASICFCYFITRLKHFRVIFLQMFFFFYHDLVFIDITKIVQTVSN